MQRDQKIILVGYSAGRCGSSAVMGLLKLAGADTGTRTVKPKKKGYHEPRKLVKFIQKTFPDSYGSLSPPPSYYEVLRKARENETQYRKVHNKIFKGNVAAIKSPRLLTLPFYDNPKIILLSRDHDTHIESILKYNKIESTVATRVYFRSFIRLWENFLKAMLYSCEIKSEDCFELRWGELLKNPVEVTKGICEFCGLEMPDPDKVREWLK